MLPAPEDPNDIDPLFPAQVGELLEEDVEEAIMKAAPDDPGEIRGFSPRIPAAGPPPREERVGAAEDAAEPLAAAAAAAAGTPLPLESAPAPGSMENLKPCAAGPVGNEAARPGRV
mmetsp:Transcript_18377/g.25834  ORF Transcript_18377/g.25834 Transcript_18377/m.25834 type:complete len:116 (-) Transcript_18377:158-505(-)